ncbi:hypothetical protein [Thermaurantiacus sp.]
MELVATTSGACRLMAAPSLLFTARSAATRLGPDVDIINERRAEFMKGT